MTDQAKAYAWPGGKPRLTHMGINVTDLETMVDFYTRVFGFHVSDRGFSQRLKCNLTFMTMDPAEHHQLVFVDIRPEGSDGNINQISFKVNSLDDLRDAKCRLAEEGIEANPISHGNAWSIYFPDPEGNLVEVYLASPFYVPQPHGTPLDLTLSDDEILRTTEAQVREVEGFMTQEEWASKVTGQMQDSV